MCERLLCVLSRQLSVRAATLHTGTAAMQGVGTQDLPSYIGALAVPAMPVPADNFWVQHTKLFQAM